MALPVVAMAVLVVAVMVAAATATEVVAGTMMHNHFHNLDMVLALLDSDALCHGQGFHSG
jgi:hypothetical protein